MFEHHRVLWVAGGREYSDPIARRRVKAELERVYQSGGFEVLVTGAALGADTIAETAWRQMELPYVGVPAQWSRYGNGAGPIRNREIALLEPDALLTFPGGRGTADARLAAADYGIPSWRVDDPK